MPDTPYNGRLRRAIPTVAPALLWLYLTVKFIYGMTIGWWLGSILQWRDDSRLWRDAQFDMPFLFEKGPRRIRRWKPLPFNYAEIVVLCEHLRISISRGRGEVGVYISRDDNAEGGSALTDLVRELHPTHLSTSSPMTLSVNDRLLHTSWQDIVRTFLGSGRAES